MAKIHMRAGTSTSIAGRAAALLASVLTIGTAVAAEDTTIRDATPAPVLHAALSDGIPLVAAADPPASVASDASIDGLGPALGSHVLGGLRGGDDSADNTILVNGLVDGNHAENILSGANTIGGEAFGNASGINTVIQNSGSNVLVQNAMIVNVQFGVPSP